MAQGLSSDTQVLNDADRAQPLPPPDDSDDRTEVWNLTVARVRIPNGQVIRPNASTKVSGWGVWKGDDVIRSWIQTGALTETDPEAEPSPEIPGTEGGRRGILSGTTAVGPVASVFTGRVEGLQEPRLGPAGGEQAPSSQEGSGETVSTAQEAPEPFSATTQQSL